MDSMMPNHLLLCGQGLAGFWTWCFAESSFAYFMCINPVIPVSGRQFGHALTYSRTTPEDLSEDFKWLEGRLPLKEQKISLQRDFSLFLWKLKYVNFCSPVDPDSHTVFGSFSYGAMLPSEFASGQSAPILLLWLTFRCPFSHPKIEYIGKKPTT